MIICEREDEYSIRIEFYHHRAIVVTKYIIKAMFNRSPDLIFREKRRIVAELNNNDFHFRGKKKELLNAWRKVDSRFDFVYREEFPRGGRRENVGRPKGIRTQRTERLGFMVTPKEKELIVAYLNKLRGINGK